MNESTPTISTPSQLEGPRPAQLHERDELIAMINFVFRISTGRPPTIATDWAHVYAPENLANVMVVCDPLKRGDTREGIGNLVASTGVWASDVVVGNATLRVGGINCVGTLPEYRRHGLGAKVMDAAYQTMRDLGCQVGILSTGITNWYRRMGWEEAGTARTYRFNRGNIALLPQLANGQRVRFANLTEGDAAETNALFAQALRLYAEARLGARRTVESFRQRTTARQVERIVLLEAEHEALAYLLLHENSIVEWAGAAHAVAALVRATFESLDTPQASTSQRARERTPEDRPLALRALTLQTPGWQHPLVNLLDEERFPFGNDYLGMLIVIDPQAILDAYGVTDVQITAAGDLFDITHKDKSITLNRNQLAKLFFGPERISPFAAEIFPLAFWQWGLEKV